MSELHCFKRHISLSATRDLSPHFDDCDGYYSYTGDSQLVIETYALSTSAKASMKKVFSTPAIARISGNPVFRKHDRYYVFEFNKLKNNELQEDANGYFSRIEKVSDYHYRLTYSNESKYEFFDCSTDIGYDTLLDKVIEDFCPDAVGANNSGVYSSCIKYWLHSLLLENPEEAYETAVLDDYREGQILSDDGTLDIDAYNTIQADDYKSVIFEIWHTSGTIDQADMKTSDGNWNLEAMENCQDEGETFAESRHFFAWPEYED